MPAERWINAGFVSQVGLPEIYSEMLSDLRTLQYVGVRNSIAFFDFYNTVNPWSTSYAYKYSDPGGHPEYVNNLDLLYSQIDPVAKSGLKLVFILAFGPDPSVDMVNNTHNWSHLNNDTFPSWPLYTRPPTGVPANALWDAMAARFNAMIAYIVARWQSFGRDLADLRFEWWDEPFTVFPVGPGGSAVGGVDADFQKMSQRIVPQLNTLGCRLYGANFTFADPSNPSRTGLPIDYVAYMAAIDSQLAQYNWPFNCTDWCFDIYPEPVGRDHGGPAYFADLIGTGADNMIRALRDSAFCANKPIHITEFGVRGNWINQGLYSNYHYAPPAAAVYMGSEFRQYDTIERGETLAAIEQRLLDSGAESICLYTLADPNSESTGDKHGLRSYDRNYANAFRSIAKSIGVELAVQPFNAMAWPAQRPDPVDPLTIPGIQLCLEAWAGNLFTTSAGALHCVNDGDPVGRWEDRTTTTPLNATQSIAGDRPVYKLNQFGGFPGVQSDGLLQYFSLVATPALTDFHLLVLGIFGSDSATLGSSGGTDAVEQNVGGANTLRYFAGGSSNVSTACPILMTGPTLIEVVRQGPNAFFYQNGILVTTLTSIGTSSVTFNQMFRESLVIKGAQATGAVYLFNRRLADWERGWIYDAIQRKVPM